MRSLRLLIAFIICAFPLVVMPQTFAQEGVEELVLDCPPSMPDPSEKDCLQDKYNRGQMGHSQGSQIPDRIRKMMKQEWRDTHGSCRTEEDDMPSCRGADEWFSNFVHDLGCIGAASRGQQCAGDSNPGINVPWKQITGVAILCGGTAVKAIEATGPVGKTPVAALGEAAGGCLFGVFVGIWASS